MELEAPHQIPAWTMAAMATSGRTASTRLAKPLKALVVKVMVLVPVVVRRDDRVR